jgi:hypothetical protein
VPGHKFSDHFLFGEWTDVVDAWQLGSWDSYRDVSRLGRKTRIGGKQREVLWSIFERVRAGLAEKKVMTWADVFGRLTDDLEAGGKPPFDHAVVDEAQDLGVAEARFLAALAATKPDGLFFSGDVGQRIFQQPFSWKGLGLDVRVALPRCASTIGHRTRSGLAPIGYYPAPSRTWTAMPKAAAVPCLCSTARFRRFRRSRARRKNRKPLGVGSPPGSETAASRKKLR